MHIAALQYMIMSWEAGSRILRSEVGSKSKTANFAFRHTPHLKVHGVSWKEQVTTTKPIFRVTSVHSSYLKVLVVENLNYRSSSIDLFHITCIAGFL